MSKKDMTAHMTRKEGKVRGIAGLSKADICKICDK
jgi:hypothetical protein